MIGHAELSAAVESGERVVLGLPVRVGIAGGYATLDLVARRRGDPSPYTETRIDENVIVIDTCADAAIHVGGMRVADRDMPQVIDALLLRSSVGGRHSANANHRRLKAGRSALAITDNMVRARVLDHVDGWSALIDVSTIIDDTPEGRLLRPGPELQLTCGILIVRCPSTGRVYSLRVPSEYATVSAARSWVLHGQTPEVET